MRCESEVTKVRSRKKIYKHRYTFHKILHVTHKFIENLDSSGQFIMQDLELVESKKYDYLGRTLITGINIIDPTIT